MIKATIIADIIAYYSKMSMTEVFLSNVAVLQHVTLLKNGTHHGYHPENCTKYINNNFTACNFTQRQICNKRFFGNFVKFE